MLSDNSRIQRCLGGGNKIASISVSKLWPFFSEDPRGERTDGNVSISPCPSPSLPDPCSGIHVFTATIRRELGDVSPFIRPVST
jgi:hypothetical protein